MNCAYSVSLASENRKSSKEKENNEQANEFFQNFKATRVWNGNWVATSKSGTYGFHAVLRCAVGIQNGISRSITRN